MLTPTTPVPPNLRDLLRLAREQRKAIEATRQCNASTYLKRRNEGHKGSEPGRDSGETQDPRKRDLSDHEIECAVRMELIPPQLPMTVDGYGGLWGLK